MTRTLERVANLPLWRGAVTPQPILGGLSNENFKVIDKGVAYVVRVTGPDQPVHGLRRENEIAASRAAHAAGLAPELVHAEHGLSVLRWIEGRPLTEADLAHPAMIDRIVPLLRRCHDHGGLGLRGAPPFFWVFHALRCYLDELNRIERVPTDLGDLVSITALLESACGPTTIAFTHNDMIPGNFIDDGNRLWLIDWEYAGFGVALFDLAGVVIHGDLDQDRRSHLYRRYFGRSPSRLGLHRFNAMIAACALRESLWAHVQAARSPLALDYAGHAKKFDARFLAAQARFLNDI